MSGKICVLLIIKGSLISLISTIKQISDLLLLEHMQFEIPETLNHKKKI